jgi:hypothetical protein
VPEHSCFLRLNCSNSVFAAVVIPKASAGNSWPQAAPLSQGLTPLAQKKKRNQVRVWRCCTRGIVGTRRTGTSQRRARSAGNAAGPIWSARSGRERVFTVGNQATTVAESEGGTSVADRIVLRCHPRMSRGTPWPSASRAGLTTEGDPIRPSCTNVDAQAHAPERKYLDAASSRRPASATDLPGASSRIVVGGDGPICAGHDSATGRRLKLRPRISSRRARLKEALQRTAELGRSGHGRHCPARADMRHPLLESGPWVPRAPSGEIPQADTGGDNRKPHRQPPNGWALHFRAIGEAQNRLQVNDAGTLHRPKRAKGNQHHCG